MSKLGSVSDIGDLVCPDCRCNIITPIGVNPNSNREEKMIVHAFVMTTCPICKCRFYIEPEQAEKHNTYWLNQGL